MDPFSQFPVEWQRFQGASCCRTLLCGIFSNKKASQMEMCINNKSLKKCLTSFFTITFLISILTKNDIKQITTHLVIQKIQDDFHNFRLTLKGSDFKGSQSILVRWVLVIQMILYHFQNFRSTFIRHWKDRFKNQIKIRSDQKFL
jgi:hypothetical protein